MSHRVILSYRYPTGDGWTDDHPRWTNSNIIDWCITSLARPATIWRYDRWGNCLSSAQIYRRRSKTLMDRISSHSTRTFDGGDIITVYMDIHFENSVDRELFVIAWKGRVAILDEIPFDAR